VPLASGTHPPPGPQPRQGLHIVKKKAQNHLEPGTSNLGPDDDGDDDDDDDGDGDGDGGGVGTGVGAGVGGDGAGALLPAASNPTLTNSPAAMVLVQVWVVP